MQALMPSVRLQASLNQAQNMKREALQPDVSNFTPPASIDRLELRFEGNGAPKAERERVHNLIRKCIIANNASDGEHFPDLTSKDAFEELSKGFADSFIKDPKASPEQKKQRAAYQYLVGVMAKGLKVDPATLKSHGDLKQAYLDRYKQVAGEAAVLTSLHLHKDDNEYWTVFDRYVEKQFNDVIEKGFRDSRGMINDVLQDYSYANGIVNYLHDAIIGADPSHERDVPSQLVILKQEVLNQTMGIKLPEDAKLSQVVQQIETELAVSQGDILAYYASLEKVQPILERELPEFFTEIAELAQKEGSHIASRDLAPLDLALLSKTSPERRAEQLKTTLFALTYNLVRYRMKKAEPQAMIQAFGLNLPSTDPAALKRFFKGKI